MSLDLLVGRRIQQAREEVGFSQEELARKLGYSSATAVHYLEKGQRKLKVEDLRKLSQIFNKKVDFFLKEEPTDQIAAILYRASFELAPPSHNELTRLMKFFELREAGPPSLDKDLSGLRPYAAAEKLLALSGVKRAPVDLERVATYCGIQVEPWSFDSDISAVLIKSTSFVGIGVNENHPEVRMRFSIAHEIGHYVLGHAEDLYIEYFAPEMIQEQTTQRAHQEREANWFAADLLMPSDWIRSEWKTFGDVKTMSDLFNVSEQAMWIRLQHLGMPSSEHKNDLPF